MNNVKVSVIVPIYNASKTIKRCVDSILKQTYKDIEIILLDDGSKDDSLSVITTLYERESSVKILHNNNKGVSYTRNIGIQISRGEWIMFVDADDYLEPIAIELLMSKAEESCSDVVIGNFFYENNFSKSSESFLLLEMPTIFESDEIKKLIWSCIDSRFFGNSNTVTNIGVPWARIYKKSSLGNNKFDETLSMMEDMLFNIHVFSEVDRILYYPVSIYHYVSSECSLSTKKYPDFELVAEDIVNKLEVFANQKGLESWMEHVIQYKSFCLFYESIRRQYMVEGKCNIFFLAKELKRMNEKTKLNGNYCKCLRKYYTFAQTIYGIMLRNNAFLLLALSLSFSNCVNTLRRK